MGRADIADSPASSADGSGVGQIELDVSGTNNPSRRTQLPQEHIIMVAKMKTLTDLFEDTLKDIYFAEKKILSALPKMAKATRSDDLRKAFKKHESETETQIDRLEKIFDLMEVPAKGKKCPGIEGIIE